MRLELTQKDPAILDWIQGLLGGGSRYTRRRKPSNLYYLYWSGSEARRVAQILAPFTVMKRPQLDVILWWPKLTYDAKVKAVQRLKDLKRIPLTIKTTDGTLLP